MGLTFVSQSVEICEESCISEGDFDGQLLLIIEPTVQFKHVGEADVVGVDVVLRRCS